MCDYSLHGIRNRLAKEGEVLVVHRFFTGSKGLTSPEYTKPTAQPKGWIAALKKLFTRETRACAVCVPDGAKLMVFGIPSRLQEAYGLSSAEAVIFRQLSLDVHTYRDAMEFQNGMIIRLQELDDGQRVEVLALSSEKVGIGEERFIPADA
jgi:hypothetical protein